MIFKRLRFAGAVTLIEIMVAMAILVIAALGGLGYQYHAARHSRIARAEIIGIRTAQLLLEDWKSNGGSPTYDPSTLGLGFSSKLETAVVGNSGTDLYFIMVDNVPMQVLLEWINRPADAYYIDSQTGATLREISVTVTFVGASGIADEWENVAPIILTTYVKIDV